MTRRLLLVAVSAVIVVTLTAATRRRPVNPPDGIQHVTEDNPEAGEFGPGSRYRISPAMSQIFIPHRMKIVTDFLTTGKAPEHSN